MTTMALALFLAPPLLIIGWSFVAQTTRSYWTVTGVLVAVSMSGFVLLSAEAVS